MGSQSLRQKNIYLWDLIPKIPELLWDAPKIVTAIVNNFTVSKNSKLSVGEIFAKTANSYPNNICIYYEDKKWTYREFNNWINRLAHQFQSLGIQNGDVVAIGMENRPELLAIVMALAKIGGIAALLNIAQRKQALIHSITLAKPTFIIIGAEFYEAYSAIRKDIFTIIQKDYIISSDTEIRYKPIPYFEILSEGFPQNEPHSIHDIYAFSPMMYIYTSGTTGLPKASVMSHGRWFKGYSAFGLASLRLTSKDIMYVPLPFFHATAMLVCWSSVVAGGAAMVIKKKFSVSEFWVDIALYKATTFGYVGEMCKYLLNSPLQPDAQALTLTKMIGNGLRPDIWQAFKDRFGIAQIMEFYGSSEGNIAFFNLFNMDATMGFSITDYAVVEYDTVIEKVVKDKKGFLKKVKKNESGLLLGAITERYPYDGYTEKDKTEDTILRNVFKKGDAWFNTGDMVREMGWNHVQFVDRLGDTFRWKGENVSTQEVEGIFHHISDIEDCIVYGVEIPQHNGKAGMACITCSIAEETKIVEPLYHSLAQQLPPYAIPLFIRIAPNTKTTDTFKHIKSHLKKEAFHLPEITDKIYVVDNKSYIPLSSEIYELILEGEFGF